MHHPPKTHPIAVVRSSTIFQRASRPARPLILLLFPGAWHECSDVLHFVDLQASSDDRFNVASRCIARSANIKPSEKIDHENAYLQLRSLGLRASVCNQVFNGSLFTLHRYCSAAAMRVVTLVRSFKNWNNQCRLPSLAIVFRNLLSRITSSCVVSSLRRIHNTSLIAPKRHGLASLAFRI